MRFLQGDDQLDKYNMLGRLQVAVIAGIIVILLYSVQFSKSIEFLRIFGVGILAAGGFLLVGFLLGFIFAIPRMASAKSVEAGSPASAGKGTSLASSEDNGARTRATDTVETNSNLVEISDWLTKILVGVSLVELDRIPGRLGELTTYLGKGLTNCNNTAEASSCLQSAQSFSLGIVIFFFAAGFLIGYLWTRLYLQRALSELSTRAERVDRTWTNIYLAELKLRDGRLGEANSLIDQALLTNPTHPGALFTKGRILKRLAQVEGKPGNAQQLEEALKYVSQSAALKPTVPGPFYNIACYQALLGKDRSDILKNLQRAFQLDSKLKQAAVTDEDLITLRDDPEFKRLTGNGSEAG
jgi:tetratricopeptide (TPR) repeat protein